MVRSFPPLSPGGIKHPTRIASSWIYEISWTGSRSPCELLSTPSFRSGKEVSWAGLDVCGVPEQGSCSVCTSDWTYFLLSRQFVEEREVNAPFLNKMLIHCKLPPKYHKRGGKTTSPFFIVLGNNFKCSELILQIIAPSKQFLCKLRDRTSNTQWGKLARTFLMVIRPSSTTVSGYSVRDAHPLTWGLPKGK